MLPRKVWYQPPGFHAEIKLCRKRWPISMNLSSSGWWIACQVSKDADVTPVWMFRDISVKLYASVKTWPSQSILYYFFRGVHHIIAKKVGYLYMQQLEKTLRKEPQKMKSTKGVLDFGGVIVRTQLQWRQKVLHSRRNPRIWHIPTHVTPCIV